MNIELFDPQKAVEGLVLLPARFAQPLRDGTTHFRYVKHIKQAFHSFKMISYQYSKEENRVKAMFEISRYAADMSGSKFAINNRLKNPPIRSVFDLKLDIPRGALSTQKITTYKIVEAPVNGEHPVAGKLRTGTGDIIEIDSDKKRTDVYHKMYEWLYDYYCANGCPAEVDRRKLPEVLRAYTGDLREPWRARQHAFSYPANGLATCLADMLTGRREPTITLDRLLELKMIPDYPEIKTVACRAKVWDVKRTTTFAGIYQVGGACATKNTQLAHKLSIILKRKITLQDLDNDMKHVCEVYNNSNDGNAPQVWIDGQERIQLFFLATTTLTSK